MNERAGAPSEATSDLLAYALLAGAGVLTLLFGSTWLAAGLALGTWEHVDGEAVGRFCGLLVHGRSPGAAWGVVFGARPPAWTVGTTGALLSFAVGSAGALIRGKGRQRVSRHARWALRHDERTLVVPREAATRPHRLVAGRSELTRRLLSGGDCVSAVVFGPNGSGKTMGLVVPNVLDWTGSVVMTTAKSQDLAPVLGARQAKGPMFVVAPGGAPGITTSSWSPIDYASDPDAADRMAGWLVDSSGMTDDPRSRPWNAQARKYLKGLLLAASVSGRGTRGFVEWAYDGELASAHVSQILTDAGHVDVLREYRSTWRIHEEGKGSVMFTAFGLADTYNRPGVMASAGHSDFNAADLFGDRPASILLVTPQSEVERFTPYFTALISSIVHEAEQRAADAGGPVSPRVLLALDEAGNVFRYPRLPHLLTTARGNGVQLLLAYHDLAQIEHLYGGRDVARTIVSNAKMRMLLPGVGDLETLRYFSDLMGQSKVAVTSSQRGPDGRRSTSEVEQREPLASVDELQRLKAGRAVLVYENLPPAKVRLRRWFEDADLQRVASAPYTRQLSAEASA